MRFTTSVFWICFRVYHFLLSNLIYNIYDNLRHLRCDGSDDSDLRERLAALCPCTNRQRE
jgi:hypothetical protein